MTHNYEAVIYRRWHLEKLLERGGAEMGALNYTPAIHVTLENSYSGTFMVDGEPYLCGGLLGHWPGRYVLWAVVGKDSAPYMVQITRAVKQFIAKQPGRIEASCQADFAQGNRWLQLLGFEIENPPGILKQFGINGEDHIGYVKFVGAK